MISVWNRRLLWSDTVNLLIEKNEIQNLCKKCFEIKSEGSQPSKKGPHFANKLNQLISDYW